MKDLTHSMVHQIAKARIAHAFKTGNFKKVSKMSGSLQKAIDAHKKSRQGIGDLVSAIMEKEDGQ